jgi:hypothetical protein
VTKLKDNKAAIAYIESLISKIQNQPSNNSAVVKMAADGGSIYGNTIKIGKADGFAHGVDVSSKNYGSIRENLVEIGQFSNDTIAIPVLRELILKIQEGEEPNKLKEWLDKLLAVGEFGINLYNDLHRAGIFC